jgi:NAD(P)-dependent dehydrogenase (short-subunit alcohol dehydrogenase family)
MGEFGYRIWLGARNAERGETAAQSLRGLGYDVRSIDVAVEDDARVQAAAQRVKAEDGKLDILINNAGIPGTYAGPLDETVDDIRRVYEVNVFGPIRLSKAFLPLLQAGEAPNIVNVSSSLGSLAWLSDPNNRYYGVNLLGYNSSKTALNAVTVSMAKAFRPLGIRVNAADPGYTKTDFTKHQGPRSVEQAAEIIVRFAIADAHGPTGEFANEDGVLPW